MAVEIPVIIDIDKAFDDAARRVSTAIRPLRQAVDDATADMRINIAIGDSDVELMSLRDLLGQVREYIGSLNHNWAFDKLQAGLENTKRSFNELNAIIQKRGTPATITEITSLNKMREAIVLMTQEVELRTRSARMVEEAAQRQIEVNRAIEKGNAALLSDAKTMKEISDKISALRGKLENVDPTSSEWVDTANEIRTATEELARYQERLRQVMSPSTVAAPGSVDAIRQEMRRLQREWDAMARTNKFDASGNLTADAQRIVDDYRNVSQEAERYGRSLSEAAGRATTAVNRTTTALRTQSGVLDGLANTALRYFSVYSVLRLAKQIRDVTGELEFQRVALGRLIQDEEYGAQLFEQIKEQAIKSPFRIQQLVTYTKQLAAYRIEQEELFDTTQRLADISAGLGVEMNRLILAYGQVRSASVLRGQELRQFTEAGIPLVQLLADKFTELNGKATRTADVFELISKRAVPFSMISEIFEDMTDKGGMFYKMQEKQAETLKGRWEKLKDAFDIGLQTIGDTKTFETYNKVLVNGLTFLAKNLRAVPKFIEGISVAWGVYYIATTRARIATRRAAQAQIEQTVAEEAAEIARVRNIRATDAYTYALVRHRIATNALSKSFWKLWAAVVANPFGAAIAAIAGIAASIFLFKKRTDEATNAYKDLDELIEVTSRGLKDTSKVDALINRYELLATKTDLNVRESNRLYQTMSLLQEAFPELQVSVDDTTESIEEQAKKMRELNEARRQELLMRAEEKFQALQDEIMKKEKARNKLYKEQFRLRSNLAQKVAEQGSEAQKTWTKELNETNDQLTEMDTEIGKLQKRLQALDRILHPDNVNQALNAWQRFIKDNSGILVNGVTTSLFDDEQIEKWENLDAALDEIGKRKKQAQELEDSLSESIKNQTGEIREQIQAELDWARAERLRLQWLENWFTKPNVLQDDIAENFKVLLQKTFNEGNLKQYGQNLLNYLYMQTGVIPDAGLLSRPLIDAAELVKAGWEDAGEGIATVFSSVYDWEDNNGNKHNIMVTPILPDGSVLSPEELDEYVHQVIQDREHKDPQKLVLGIDVSEDAGKRLHEMQEEYYHLVQMRDDLPEKFLFSDKDVASIKEATDIIELAESKIASIEKELDAVKSVNIENLSEEEVRKTEAYKNNLEEIHDWLVKLRDKFKLDVFPGIAQDIIDNFSDILGRNYRDEDGVTIPVEFLFSDKELHSLYNAADLFDLLDKKISGIEKEIERVNEQKIDPNVPDEVIQQAEEYRTSLEGVYQALLRIQGRYRDQLTDIAKDVKAAFPDLMASAYRNAGKSGFASIGLFSDDELKRIRSIVDLYDVWSSKLQAVQKAKENFNRQISTAVDEATRQNAIAAIDSLSAQEKQLLDFMARYGFLLPGKDGSSSSQDPWILIYKNRIKFVQDFASGLERLNKFMLQNNALAKERKIMEGRGANLGFDVAQMTGTKDEVLGWYDKVIGEITEKIHKLGGKTWAGLGVQAILAKDTKSRVLKAWQDLLAEVFKQRTDFDLSQTEKDLKEAIATLKENIKRSEEAKNFFSDILSTTGDRDLAENLTVSVYGDPGADLGERIKDDIEGTLKALDIATDSGIGKTLMDAAGSMDFREVMKDIKNLPPELQTAIRNADGAIRKSNEDLMKSFAQLVSKYGDTTQKIATIREKTKNEIKNVQDALTKSLANPQLTPEERDALKKRAEEIIKALEGQRDLDIFKLSDNYVKFFSEINILTAEQAATVRGELRNAYLKAFHDGAISADELRRNLRAVDEQFKKLSESTTLLGSYLSGGFDAANAKLQEYADNVTVLAAKMKEGKELDQSEQAYATRMLQMFGSGSTEGIKNYSQLIQAFSGEGEGLAAAGEAFGQMGEGMSAMAANGPGALAIVDAIFKAVHATISGIQQIIDQLNEVRSEENKIGDWFKYVSDFDRYTFSGWEKLKSGDAIGATVDAISSWISIFNNIQKDKIKKANDEIKSQATLIKELEYTYDRLGVALEDSFGSDYVANYTQQMSVLQAQIDAYRKQADIERGKGKSADEETAKGYDEAARKIEAQIADAQTQLSEFMSGTNLTSAAQEFAQAWIEAYKEFGSTTDAMKEKFNDMIENMVVNSLAARLIQGILKPVFDTIDEASKDGALTAEDVAAISKMVPERIAMINGSMSTLMNQLTAAGLNLRQMAGGFTGISRDIAGASEESINGLAAGINTQNFYMQHIDMNVTAILAALTGGTTTAQSGTTGEYVDPYKDAMLSYAMHIPDIHTTLLDILSELSSVITLNGTKRAVQVRMS